MINLLSETVTAGRSFFQKAIPSPRAVSTDTVFGFSGSGGLVEDNNYGIRKLSYSQMYTMYRVNVWIQACINRTVEMFVEPEPLVKHLTQASRPVDAITDEAKRHIDIVFEWIGTPNSNSESFTSLCKKFAQDVLIYDAHGQEIIKTTKLTSKGNSTPGAELYAVSGASIFLNTDKRGLLLPDEAYIQLDSSKKKLASWDKDSFCYYVNNPTAGRVYGLSPLEVLVETVTADLQASAFNSQFFINNATPRFMILLENMGRAQSAPALARFKKWWDGELLGQPHRPIFIGTEAGKISFQKLGMTQDEMQFQQYSRWLLSKIMAVYKMQPLILGLIDETTGKLNSEEQVKLFKRDAVFPLKQLLTYQLNRQLVFKTFGFKDVYIDFDLGLIDKDSQAKWHEIYLRNGVFTINEIRTELGLEAVPWGNVPYLQNNLTPFGSDGKPAESNDPKNDPKNNTTSKATVKANLSWLEKNCMAVGWENLPVSERLEVLIKMIQAREAALGKTYSIGE